MSMGVVLTKAVDKYVGDFLCLSIGIFVKKNKDFKKNEIKNILVMKTWALGDSVYVLPMIKALRKEYPKSNIKVLVRKRNKIIFENQKDIDEIILFEKGISRILRFRRKYDLIIDAEPYLRITAILGFWLGKNRIGYSNQIRSRLYTKTVDFSRDKHIFYQYQDFAQKAGCKTQENDLIPIIVDKKYDVRAKKFMVSNKIKKPFIGFCPGGAETATDIRCWPIKNYADLTEKMIKEYDATIYLAGGKEDKEKINQIIMLTDEKYRNKIIDGSDYGIQDFIAILNHFDVFVSNDTGPMHIAAANGIKTIGLFGPNTPKLWAPFGKDNISLYKPGKNCEVVILNEKGAVKNSNCRCGGCIKNINVNNVYDAVKRLLRK